MNLPKAIELLDYLGKANDFDLGPDYLDAIKLGTEALKRLQHDRQWGAAVSRVLLPGETTDAPTAPDDYLASGKAHLAQGYELLAEGERILSRLRNPS